MGLILWRSRVLIRSILVVVSFVDVMTMSISANKCPFEFFPLGFTAFPLSPIIMYPTHSDFNFSYLKYELLFQNYGYVQNVVGFPRFLAQSSVLSTTGQGWNMRFVLTACYPAAGWNPPTTGTTNHGQAQTLLRYRPRIQIIRAAKYLVIRWPAIGPSFLCRTFPRPARRVPMVTPADLLRTKIRHGRCRPAQVVSGYWVQGPRRTPTDSPKDPQNQRTRPLLAALTPDRVRP